MKPVLSFILLLVYLTAIFRPVVPLVEYFARLEDFMAKCVNKEEPLLQCNGQCRLRSKIQAIENENHPAETAPGPRILKEEFHVAIIIQSTVSLFVPVSFLLTNLSTPGSDRPTSGFLPDVFRPPLQLL